MLAMGLSPAMAQQTGEYAKMNKFIDNLMSKMTLQEKLGQLNLPVTGEIVTGQAKSSDVAGKNQTRRSWWTLQLERCEEH